MMDHLGMLRFERRQILGNPEAYGAKGRVVTWFCRIRSSHCGSLITPAIPETTYRHKQYRGWFMTSMSDFVPQPTRAFFAAARSQDAVVWRTPGAAA